MKLPAAPMILVDAELCFDEHHLGSQAVDLLEQHVRLAQVVQQARAKYDVRVARKIGLNDIAFVERQLISGVRPDIAVSALHPHGTVNIGEVCLLLTNFFCLSVCVGRAKVQHPGKLIDDSFGLFRKKEVTRATQKHNDEQNDQQHAAVRDSNVPNVSLVFCSGGHACA